MVRERADRNGASASTPAHASLSVAELRQLISLMDRSDIEEIIIEQEAAGLHLTLRKPAPVVVDHNSMLALAEPLEAASAPALESAPAQVDDAAGALEVRSTLVGLYRASGRRDAKVIGAGDNVKEGQIVGAIEALNVLNEIEAPATGRVRTVLVADGQPVEYGQVLMSVEPRNG
jgi:acetyl-CoA carboxylase biotin carboxyl carrier protein